MVDGSNLHQKRESLCTKDAGTKSLYQTKKNNVFFHVSVASISWAPSLSSAPAAGTQNPHASKFIHDDVTEPCWVGVKVLKEEMRRKVMVNPGEKHW